MSRQLLSGSLSASSKRPRTNEDHEELLPKTKARRSDVCDVEPVPSKVVMPSLAKLTTTGDSLNLGPRTVSSNSNSDPIMSVPEIGDPSTSEPHTKSLKRERNKQSVMPTPLQCSSSTLHLSTPGSPMEPSGTERTAPSNTETRVTVGPSNVSTTQKYSESAASKVHRRDLIPSLPRDVYGRFPNPFHALQHDRGLDSYAQPSVSTAVLVHPGSTSLLEEKSIWLDTPFKLTQAGNSNTMCPRLVVSDGSELCKVLGTGQYPIATAIAKIHAYGYENHSVPKEAQHVLSSFDFVRRHCSESRYITLIDPLLYDSDTYTHHGLDKFRRLEWAWLARAGRPITFPGRLHGYWDFVTITPNYELGEVALVLARGEDTLTLVSGGDVPTNLEPIQLYENARRYHPSPIPSNLSREALEHIVLCWSEIPFFNPEDIAAVIQFRYRLALKPYHVDELRRATFERTQPWDCSRLVNWASTLTDIDKAERRAHIMELRVKAIKSQSYYPPIFGW